MKIWILLVTGEQGRNQVRILGVEPYKQQTPSTLFAGYAAQFKDLGTLAG